MNALWVAIARPPDAGDDPALTAAVLDASQAIQGLLGRLRECGADSGGALQLIVDAVQGSTEPIALVLQSYLDDLEGRSFGSLDGNRSFARALNDALDALNAAVRCPTCGEPGRLFVKAGTSPDGAFSIRHPDRSMHSGRATLPRLEVVRRSGSGA